MNTCLSLSSAAAACRLVIASDNAHGAVIIVQPLCVIYMVHLMNVNSTRWPLTFGTFGQSQSA